MTTEHAIERAEAEDFLYLEAALLDEWRLDEWLGLFDESARYFVPTTDLPDADPKVNLVLIDDDIERLRSRVVRLKSRHAHREFPWSRTRRLVTNIRVTPDGEATRVAAAFALYRFRGGNSDVFVGHYEYRLVRRDGNIRITYRKAVLDQEALRPHGAVSMIL